MLPDTSVTSIRYGCPVPPVLVQAFIPVPDTSVSSVRHPKLVPGVPVLYRTHTRFRFFFGFVQEETSRWYDMIQYATNAENLLVGMKNFSLFFVRFL